MTEDREPVGSVAEEAAKLFEALQSRTGETAAGGAPGAGLGMLAGLGALLGDVGKPVDGAATHNAECRSCPVCRGIALFRGISGNPEVKHHLAMAADSLLQAVTEAMQTRAPGEAETSARDSAEQPGRAAKEEPAEDDAASG